MKKIEPKFLYTGLGFPVELENVEMIELNDEWHPKIDVHYIADETIKKLASQEEKLTENQIKFIFAYFSVPLSGFGMTEKHGAYSTAHTLASRMCKIWMKGYDTGINEAWDYPDEWWVWQDSDSAFIKQMEATQQTTKEDKNRLKALAKGDLVKGKKQKKRGKL